MQILFYLLLAIIAGVLIPVQSVFNAKLGDTLRSPIYGALLSFVVGITGLFLYALAQRVDFGQLKNVSGLPWYYFTGGLMGAFFVLTLIVAPPRLGMALTLGITVAAQLGFGLLMDHYGWLGLRQVPVTLTQILGVGLILVGVYLLRN